MQIREVWSDNLEEEFDEINKIVDEYPYVAMDTEFPGTIIDTLEVDEESRYMKVRDNVNCLKLIQLGLSFFDEQGNLPTLGTEDNQDIQIWQFNFCDFDVDHDLQSCTSITFLRDHGIDFSQLKERGVQIRTFAEFLTKSGAVLNNAVHWVTFDGKYDYGYLLRALTGKDLPRGLSEFLDLMDMFFPSTYDVKFMINGLDGFYGGLQSVARTLGLRREGVAHHAGSDSRLTCQVFHELRKNFFPDSLDQFRGVVFGLNHPRPTAHE